MDFIPVLDLEHYWAILQSKSHPHRSPVPSLPLPPHSPIFHKPKQIIRRYQDRTSVDLPSEAHSAIRTLYNIHITCINITPKRREQDHHLEDRMHWNWLSNQQTLPSPRLDIHSQEAHTQHHVTHPLPLHSLMLHTSRLLRGFKFIKESFFTFCVSLRCLSCVTQLHIRLQMT